MMNMNRSSLIKDLYNDVEWPLSSDMEEALVDSVVTRHEWDQGDLSCGTGHIYRSMGEMWGRVLG